MSTVYLTLTSVVFELFGRAVDITSEFDLTLTSVVFESVKKDMNSDELIYLTLTSVVFESGIAFVSFRALLTFNFNKCCI